MTEIPKSQKTLAILAAIKEEIEELEAQKEIHINNLNVYLKELEEML